MRTFRPRRRRRRSAIAAVGFPPNAGTASPRSPPQGPKPITATGLPRSPRQNHLRNVVPMAPRFPPQHRSPGTATRLPRLPLQDRTPSAAKRSRRSLRRGNAARRWRRRAVARQNAGRCAGIPGWRAPTIARTRQHGIELLANQRFDERPNPRANGGLDRIHPTQQVLGSALTIQIQTALSPGAGP
jgi:hypothetical protein